MKRNNRLTVIFSSVNVKCAVVICVMTATIGLLSSCMEMEAITVTKEIPDAVETSTEFICGKTLTIVHTIDSIAPETKTVSYGTVLTNLTGGTAKCWITQNLGATRQASSATDTTGASAGWYWQFNRKQGYTIQGTTDQESLKASNQASAITPVWTITVIDENSNWLPANDPCTIELGMGWRIPTLTEWYSADDSPQNWNNYTDTYNSVLKLHAPGTWRSSDGAWCNRGGAGCYWSSTQYTSLKGWYLSFASIYSYTTPFDKSLGLTLRCLKD